MPRVLLVVPPHYLKCVCRSALLPLLQCSLHLEMGLKTNFYVYGLTQQLLHRASIAPTANALDLMDLGSVSMWRNISIVRSIWDVLGKQILSCRVSVASSKLTARVMLLI